MGYKGRSYSDDRRRYGMSKPTNNYFGYGADYYNDLNVCLVPWRGPVDDYAPHWTWRATSWRHQKPWTYQVQLDSHACEDSDCLVLLRHPDPNRQVVTLWQGKLWRPIHPVHAYTRHNLLNWLKLAANLWRPRPDA